MNASASYTAAIGRLFLAAIFLASGFQKILTPEQTQATITLAGLPQPVALYWASTAVEILGGLGLALGFMRQLAALTLALFSLAAAVLFHLHVGSQNEIINFMKDIAIAGGLLQVVAHESNGTNSIAPRK